MWPFLARNVHRIAVVALAALFVLLFVNAFVVSDQDATRRSELPIAAEEADRRGESVVGEPSQVGLLVGFGLLGGWAVLGVFIFSKPARQRAADSGASEA